MNEPRHTPGPWRVNGILIEGPRMALTIASVRRPALGTAPVTKAESEANATLIAASPRLLKALEVLHRRYLLAIGNEGPEALEARAAIVEATGGSP